MKYEAGERLIGKGFRILKTTIYTKQFPHYCTSSTNEIHSFITTPIFYVNAKPHIGHLYSALIADAHHRFNLMTTGTKSLIFSSGTDEHGMKIEKAAIAQGKNAKEHCDTISESFRQMVTTFNIGCTDFIRTTEPRHLKAVAHFWKTLQSNGYIYKSQYEGWYCTTDETFLSDSQITEKKMPDGKMIKISSESGHPVEWSCEENYMFQLERFRPQILDWLRTKTPVIPSKFCSIVTRTVEESCFDLSISRPKSRLTWGIPVPDDQSQVIYVWLDALINYLTVTGYPEKTYLWPPTAQIIGKDILKFHAIYWPAFLMAAGLEPPRQILCHSHWVVDNVKMSKSLGNVVDPFELARKYGSDAVRYFLLNEGVPHSDGNFNEEKLRRMVNAELADTFGNLLSRCASKALNPNQIWPEFREDHFMALKSPNGVHLRNALISLPEKVEANYKTFNCHRSIEHIMATLRLANVFVEEEKPWELVKISPREPKLLAMTSLVFEVLRVTGTLIWPIVPNLSTFLLNRLDVPNECRKWSSAQKFIWDEKHEEKSLANSDNVLFRRIKI